MNTKTRNKGFTLTEILIVLVIAGILLALILPNSLKAIATGNKVAGNSDVQSCSTAVLACYSDNKGAGATNAWTGAGVTTPGVTGTDCTSITTVVGAGYLPRIGNNASGKAITVSPSGTGYTCI